MNLPVPSMPPGRLRGEGGREANRTVGGGGTTVFKLAPAGFGGTTAGRAGATGGLDVAAAAGLTVGFSAGGLDASRLRCGCRLPIAVPCLHSIGP